MNTGAKDIKKIERRARAMLTNKQIPSEKMDLVRSLLSNNSLLPEEKYSAIIDLVKSCPDKPVSVTPGINAADPFVEKERPKRKTVAKSKSAPLFGPTPEAVFINRIYSKYKYTGFFKKKYLFPANNIFRFTVRKRLIPTKKLYKFLHSIRKYQENLSVRIPEILTLILEDDNYDSPVIYNYIKQLYELLQNIPVVSVPLGRAIWMNYPGFERELKEYTKLFLSIMDMDNSTKEQIISTIETKLREMDDLKKEDTESSSGTDAEKRNLNREKYIYDYMVTLRSFIPVYKISSGGVDKVLQRKFGIDNYADFLLILNEVLVFRHTLAFDELRNYYSIRPLEVNSEKWDCPNEELKRVGKDEESRVKKYRERLQQEIEPLDETVKYITVKNDGMDVLTKSFDDQWRVINKRRQEYGNLFEENFFLFLDECVNYFYNSLLPFIDGTVFNLTDSFGRTYNSSVFSVGYFEMKKSTLNDILDDLVTYRTNNPSSIVTRDEAAKIMSGQLSTMSDVKNFLARIGDLFYQLAVELHSLERLHKKWLMNKENNKKVSPYKALTREDLPSVDLEDEKVRPFPFYDCRIQREDMHSPFIKLHSGKLVYGDSVKESVMKYIIAFSYQVAYECHEETLYNDLAHRKDIRRKLKELVGRI